MPSWQIIQEWAVEFVTNQGRGFHPRTAASVVWDHRPAEEFAYNAGDTARGSTTPIYDLAYAPEDDQELWPRKQTLAQVTKVCPSMVSKTLR